MILKSILYKERFEEQITDWINKINFKKSYFNRDKLKNGSKYQREERYDTDSVATRVKY